MGEYEETLADMENTLSEIDLERARYLLSTDDILEEMLNENQTDPVDKMRAGNKARTVCCRVLVDTNWAPVARTITGELFLVCNDDCRKFIETATSEQISELISR